MIPPAESPKSMYLYGKTIPQQPQSERSFGRFWSLRRTRNAFGKSPPLTYRKLFFLRSKKQSGPPQLYALRHSPRNLWGSEWPATSCSSHHCLTPLAKKPSIWSFPSSSCIFNRIHHIPGKNSQSYWNPIPHQPRHHVREPARRSDGGSGGGLAPNGTPNNPPKAVMPQSG